MAIRPIFAQFNHGMDAWNWGLSPEDFDKVQKGYACGRCLEDYGGKWLAKCPVCGETQEVVVETPPEWRYH